MAAVTISYDDWKNGTNLGALHMRSSEMEAIDKALREYQQGGRSETAFYKLKAAFDNWIRSQQKAGKIWTASGRNQGGIVSRLHEQIIQVDAERGMKLLRDPKEMAARKAMLQGERDAIKRLFENRRLVLKQDAVQSNLKRTFTSSSGAAAKVGSAIRTGHKQLAGAAPVAVTPTDVNTLILNLTGGKSPEAIYHLLGASAEGFCSAAAAILSAALSPAKLLKDIVKAGMLVNDRMNISSARFSFRIGQADAAIDAILRLLDLELKMVAVDMSKQVASIVAHSFAVGPIASAANAVVDVLVNARTYARMAEEIKRGNMLLSSDQFSLQLFDASPVLGCYFLILADTSVWINFSVFDIGTPGWMDTVDVLRKRAEPVIEKAREYVRVSKYVLSGTEYMKGLEWEPSWRNNKVAYLARHTDLGYLKNKVTGGTTAPLKPAARG